MILKSELWGQSEMRRGCAFRRALALWLAGRGKGSTAVSLVVTGIIGAENGCKRKSRFSLCRMLQKCYAPEKQARSRRTIKLTRRRKPEVKRGTSEGNEAVGGRVQRLVVLLVGHLLLLLGSY